MPQVKNPKSDRTSPEFWEHEAKQFYEYAKVPLSHFVRYAARYAGDYRDVPYAVTDPANTSDKQQTTHRPALANLTNLAARRTLASLYYRNPRFIVKPPLMEKAIFTPLLAKLETTRLNRFAERSNLYRHMRKALLDGALGPFFVLKLTYDFDMALDTTRVETQREVANQENQKFVLTGVGPRLKQDDHHETHIQVHENLIAAAQRGEIQLPKSAIKYLKLHVQKHREEIPWSRPAEFTRNSRVNVRRINPRNFSFDPWQEEFSERTWFREHFVARLEDVLANPDFSPKAKEQLKDAKGVHPKSELLAEVYGLRVMEPYDRHVHLYEVLDRVDNKIILYGENTSIPLQVRDYTMNSILRSGPYVEGCFLDDPMNGFGVCMPYIYEAHQDEMALLEGVNNRTVEVGGPKYGYNGKAMAPETVEQVAQFGIGETVNFEHLKDGQKIADVIQQLPALEPPAGSINQAERNHRWFEILSGHGSAQLGGGDFSRTATASDVVSESTSTLMEDMAAVVDQVSTQVGKVALRYMRACDDQEIVRQELGNDAIQPGGWPQFGFADQDIVDDRGVGVVQGSSRRNDSAIVTKQIESGLALFLQSPLAMIATDVDIELFRRYFESIGQFGIDWDSLQAAALGQQAQALLGDPEGPGGPQGVGGPMGPPQGAGATGEPPTRSGMAQGMNNVGGGRVPTGASKGDKGRPFGRGSPSPRGGK